jgi:hypothetical protein
MKRAHPEDAIQKAVADHIRMRGVAGLVAWHTPNGMKIGGKRNRKGVPIQAARMKGLGVRAGVSDWILVHARNIYALELKPPGGCASDAQLEFLADMEAAGAFCCVAVGLDQALQILERWGLLKGRAA